MLKSKQKTRKIELAVGLYLLGSLMVTPSTIWAATPTPEVISGDQHYVESTTLTNKQFNVTSGKQTVTIDEALQMDLQLAGDSYYDGVLGASNGELVIEGKTLEISALVDGGTGSGSQNYGVKVLPGGTLTLNNDVTKIHVGHAGAGNNAYGVYVWNGTLNLNSKTVEVMVSNATDANSYIAGMELINSQVTAAGDSLKITAVGNSFKNATGMELWHQGGAGGDQSFNYQNITIASKTTDYGNANGLFVGGSGTATFAGEQLSIKANALGGDASNPRHATGISVAKAGGKTINLDSKNTFIDVTATTGKAVGIQVDTNSTVNITGNLYLTTKSDVPSGQGPDSLSVLHEGKIFINQANQAVVSQVEGNMSAADSGAEIVANFKGEQSYFLGTATQAVMETDIPGSVKLGFADGATWRLSASMGFADIAGLNLERGIVDMTYNTDEILEGIPFDKRYQTLQVKELTGTGGKFILDADLAGTTGKDRPGTKGDYIEIEKANAGTYYVQFQNQATKDAEEGQKLLILTDASNNINLTGLRTESGGLWNLDPVLAHEGNDWYLTQLTKTVSGNTQALITGAGSAYYHWRNGNQALSKVLGEVKGKEDGIWAKTYKGKLAGSDYAESYQAYQLGYNKQVGRNDFGVVVESSKGQLSTGLASGENKFTTFSAYGNWGQKDGAYTEVVLRAGTLRQELNVQGKFPDQGDYDSKAYSLSLEYGKQLDLGKGWRAVPQAELIVGKMLEADYTTEQGTQVVLDGRSSCIARLGAELSHSLGDHARVNFTASVNREFLGDQELSLAAKDGQLQLVDEVGGTWYEMGLGVNGNLSKNTSAYLEVERSFGARVSKKWQLSGGVNWTF
ncbi:MAG: autotransporter outer membrane beta-barrel domain-containing protein [Acidaminococcaceae bacterium]